MSGIGVLRLPRDVQFGSGARAGLARAVATFGDRVFVAVDPFLAEKADFQQALQQLRASATAVQVHSEIVPELPVDSLQTVAETARAFGPNVIVGWGGGSVLDAAKLVALLLAHGGELQDYYGENAVPGPVLPLVAVPTTAGTGSEATPVAVVSDADRELKVGISSPHLIPQVAVVDPDLTVGAPQSVSAYAGMDALVHAIESYTAVDLQIGFDTLQPVFVGRNLLSDPLALEAMRLIGSALDVVVAEPHDRDARNAMARGSLLAGMAFANTGTHLSHAIQYPIGALTHTPHGLGTGLMLPYVMEACADVVGDRMERIAEALDVGTDGGLAIERVAEIAASVGIPATLADIDVDADDLSRIADLALGSRRLVDLSPVPADHNFLLRILTAAHAGDRAALRA